jgi:hypothetical protein
MTIGEARSHIGHAVVYRPCCPHCDFGRKDGQIATIASGRVYVRFGYDTGSTAVSAADLELFAGSVPLG